MKTFTIFSMKFEGLGTSNFSPTKTTIKKEMDIIIKLNPNNIW
ncbi:hypothetical protein [Tissierella creatinophila]|nr:hypothetical protein [Tissierella creatinophila]